jgi:hypothetical protein
MRKLLSLLFISTLALVFAQNSEVTLNQEEFTTLLTGNTLVGEWAGVPYRQFFAEDGRTLYLSGGSKSKGTWRITETGDYCSVWPPSQSEDCYKVTKLGDELIWYSGDDRYSSHVEAGNVLEQ